MPTSNSSKSGDSGALTLLVFKENFAARTFKIPLAWITRFGVILGVLAGFTLVTSFLAIKYYRIALQADPVRVQDLEAEIVQLKAAAKAAPVAAAAPAPVQTKEVEPPPAPIVASAPVAAAGQPLLFSALPAKILAPPADRSTLPFTIENMKVTSKARKLTVSFALQYQRTDGGSQQGRIIILARGSDSLVTHPDSVLTDSGSDSLINPEQGEYFSVSRYREVKAEFVPVQASGSLKSAEVLIFSSTGQLLIHEVVSAKPETEAAAAPAAKPAAPAKPAQKTAPTEAAPAARPMRGPSSVKGKQ